MCNDVEPAPAFGARVADFPKIALHIDKARTAIKNVQNDTAFSRAQMGGPMIVKGAFGFPIKIRGQLAAVLKSEE